VDNEEVYTDEQLNEIIARDEKEYDMFMTMDQDRYDSEDRMERIKLIKQNKAHKRDLPDEKINYRLIQEWEVPQWIRDSVVEDKEEDALMASLGKRKRNEVNYRE